MKKDILNQDYHSSISKKAPFIVVDWAGNLMDFGRFESFDDAEEFLSIRLGDDYETDRGEYYIVKDTK